MALQTLDAMYRGGLFDHIGGGFSRYSTDERWLIPHFEKMLYDNALLARWREAANLQLSYLAGEGERYPVGHSFAITEWPPPAG